MNATTCQICAENFNKSNRKSICCLYCSFEACQGCCQQYMLTKTNPGCMNNACHQEWTHAFLTKNISKTFLAGAFRKHRETICFDTEKALLPATQTVVEDILRFEQQIKDREELIVKTNLPICIQHIKTGLGVFLKTVYKGELSEQQAKERLYLVTNAEYYRKYFGKKAKISLHNLVSCFHLFDLLKKSIEKNTEASAVDTQTFLESYRYIREWHPLFMDSWKKLEYEIAQLKHSIKNRYENRLPRVETVQAPAETRKFIKSCPSEECRGFLSTQWKCGLCHVKVCSKCHVVKTDEEHECQADDVATAEFLMNDTKQCPKCPTRIHKIDGCDQMWCVQCQTAFSWRTGEVVQGNIHNPHYFQWMRENNRQNMERNPLDIICGREIDHRLLYRIHSLARDRKEHLYANLLGRALENMIYFKEKVDAFQVFDVMDNHRHRIAYLKNEIDQATFKKRIFLRQKHNDMNRELRMWLLLFRDVSTDLVYNLMERLQNDLVTPAGKIMVEFRTEWFALEAMVNTNLAELSALFGIKTRSFSVKENNRTWEISKT